VNRRLLTVLAASAAVIAVVLFAVPALAQTAGSAIPIPRVNIGVSPATKPSDVALSLQILLLLTVVTLAPTLLVLLTSFTRIVIVLSFVRTALATQQVPPTQVLVGLALLLTFFVMHPVIEDINKSALQPYLANKISQPVALERAAKPLRAFMF
jgi:flagellar biosynthetic protein FliP